MYLNGLKCTVKKLSLSHYVGGEAERQKQRKPMAKWRGNVAQKFLWSRMVFSEMIVIMPESVRICQPEGRLFLNENGEDRE
ncbi:hypothetical protein DY000_02019578 [Brassica cretica]|uniref:Uncharacterized protein n=1 Tax=Brassica cretica TaxID=69181 RepID=A0ABQ7DAA2_BRACR|nr:hypothetical protein DY000_02019578 [Brassica cretica]